MKHIRGMQFSKIAICLLAAAFGLGACDIARPTPPPGGASDPNAIATQTALYEVAATQEAGTQMAQDEQGEVTNTPRPTNTPAPTQAPPTATKPPTATPIPPTATPYTYVLSGDEISLDFNTPTPNPSATPTTTAVAPDLSKRPGPSVFAAHQRSEPRLDGDIRDINALTYLADRPVFGEGYISGPEDLSGVFRLSWDSDNLYVGVIVFDSSLAQGSTGAQVWQGDSIEILIDTDVPGDFDVDSLNEDDIQLGISPGNLVEGSAPEAWVWAPEDYEGPAAGAEIVAVRTTDGWALEAAIPWSALGFTPTADTHVGFLFSISDNDNRNMNAQQSVVSFAPVRALYDPTQWYDLWLLAP